MAIDVESKVTESTGRACAVLAAASFAAILEADQIERVKSPDDWCRTVMYWCLFAAIPINILMYDYHLEKNIGRQSKLMGDRSRGALVIFGWVLSGIGFSLLFFRLSYSATIVFFIVGLPSYIVYLLYQDRPTMTHSGMTEAVAVKVAESTTPSPLTTTDPET